MAPVSASKAARLAKKAEKAAAKGDSSASSSVKGSSTPKSEFAWPNVLQLVLITIYHYFLSRYYNCSNIRGWWCSERNVEAHCRL